MVPTVGLYFARDFWDWTLKASMETGSCRVAHRLPSIPFQDQAAMMVVFSRNIHAFKSRHYVFPKF